jgi:hypothetical protein
MAISVNVGSLTTFNNLAFNLSRQLRQIRNSYMHGETPTFYFDFTNIKENNIGIPALTALLAIGKKYRDFIGYPIPVKMKWNPNVLSFLTDVEFFLLSKKFDIFEFPDEIMGGFRSNRINPDTKVLYYGDIMPANNFQKENLGTEKAKLKQKIIGNLKVRCSSILYDLDAQLENTLINTTLELIVNSLMHGEDIAFVGLQRTSKSITISVCDTGIGFKKSLIRLYGYSHFDSMSHSQAILIGSLVQRDLHGLRLAISEVLDFKPFEINNTNVGWVNISSYDSEIRWQKKVWGNAIEHFEKLKLEKELPDLKAIFHNSPKEYLKPEEVEEGYYKEFDHFLIGTRIAFEIRF